LRKEEEEEVKRKINTPQKGGGGKIEEKKKVEKLEQAKHTETKWKKYAQTNICMSCHTA